MRRLLSWLDKYFLEIWISVLLVFIPLYPKLPLFDIRYTWVYIRLEDIVVGLVVGIWLIQLARRKVSLKTPLTIPIFAYWFVGLLSLLHVIFVLGSELWHFFPHLAILHYVRRIEYMILFLIAAASVKNLHSIKKYILAIGVTLFLVIVYGFGQKFLGWPAFLTMNEEFAKGFPLYLPSTARITSTFAGHYDLAAFLVLMVPLWASLFFGFKKWLLKITSFILAFFGFILLLLTASRVSFFVYLIGITYVLFLQKKKWLIIPVIGLSLFLAKNVAGSSERFAKTFRVERVVYDTRTGKPIATLEEFLAPVEAEPIPSEVVVEQIVPVNQSNVVSTPEPSSVGPISEDSLPLGSGFFSLEGLTDEEARAQIIRRPITTSSLKIATMSSELATASGGFLVKKAIVYDISFTTRFQGEWPRAIKAFKRNILLGSGFSTISLATDNDYLRLLGETGLLGFLSFLSIFIVFGLLIRRAFKKIKLPLARSFLIGILGGTIALIVNATLIDVFEASKVAFTFWLLLGIAVGLIRFLLPKKKNLTKEALEMLQSPWTTLIILGLTVGLVFGSGIKNYFMGDDFTWLRWAFSSQAKDIPQFFTNAAGFFYRPLAKVYFYAVSPFFGLLPTGYHLVSLLLLLGCSWASYWLVVLITKKKLVAFLAAFLFLIHPINAESAFWVSTTSHLFASFFYVWGMVAYIMWRKTKETWRWVFFTLTIIAFILGLMSHERMITFPLAILFYDLIFTRSLRTEKWVKKIASHLPLWFLVTAYLWLRNTVAQSHGLSGDYNYNLKNIGFNFVGNSLGYLGELIASYHFIPVYDWLRVYLRSHKLVALAVLVPSALITTIIFKKTSWRRLWHKKQFKVIIFSLGWFVILMLPFLGLGNIAERYSFPAHLGFFLILSLLIEGLYQKLARQSKKLGLVITSVLIISLAGFYIWETDKARRDWYYAGEVTNQILRTMASNYQVFPEDASLYFLNLPIRYRRAWIFPVGLKDGLWFIYRDDTLRVHQTTNIEETFDRAENRGYARVFIYVDDELREATR